MSTDIPSDPAGSEPLPAANGPTPAAGPRRIWARALVVVGALAAIGVAGYSLKDQIPWVAIAGEAAGPGASNAPPAPAMRGVLSMAQVGPGRGGDAKALFATIGRTESASQQELISNADPRRLLNEIVRQAVLLAAHDHLGAVTRDASIGEQSPPNSKIVEAELAWTLTPHDRGSTLEIKPLGGKTTEPHVLKLPRGDSATDPVAKTYPSVLERAEVLAREELPKVFKALGVSGTPIVVKADGALPAEVSERLDTLTFTEQFAAVRAIQAAIRSDGESPQRLGGLIRGYAQLGTLTEFHWDPAHDVFKARALLMAQRWVAREPRSAEALQFRAYAFALAGLHRFALDDLSAAKALPPGARPAPDWVPLIDSYCRFDTKALLDTKPGPSRPLAMFLAVKTVEASWSPARAIELSREFLRDNPECYRVHDVVCAEGGVSVLHEATVTPLAVYAREVPRRLQAMPEFPPGIAAQLGDPAHEVAAAKALAQEGRSADRGEPSWGVLGKLMDEVRFVHVWRRARFLAFALGVPAGDFVDAARPLVVDHPYRPFIESFGVDRVHDYARYAALLQEVKIPAVDVEVTEAQFFHDILSQADPPRGNDLFREASLREDNAERDLKLFLPRTGEGDRLRNARFLEDVSPHSPLARAIRIDKSWAEVEKQARAWEADDSLPVLVALGRRYIDLKRWDDAVRCLNRAIALAPEKSTYMILAHAYKAQDDWKHWQETLDQYLKNQEDYGLDHAQVSVEIANHLMDEGQWKDAEPYAAAAAETWAAFGMICAARCYEGLKDWKTAELWTRRETERYPDQSWAKWYLFCKRTGHGDVEAAGDFTARYIASVGQRAQGIERVAFGLFHLLNGRKKDALAMFRGVTDAETLGPGVLFTALTADALGDTKLRDECLGRLVTEPQCVMKSTPIVRMYRAALAGGDAAALDLEVVDKELAAIPEENRGNAQFHVGWFLVLHGSPEKAAEYLKRCIESKTTFFWFQYAADDALKNPSGVLGKSSSQGTPGG